MRRAVVALLTLSLLAPASCGRAVRIRQRVLGFVTATEKLPRRFVYVAEVAGRQVEVRGRIEDGFRYQETLRLGGSAVLEQIVADDAVALRIMDPGKVPLLSSGVLVPGSSPIVTEALRSGQWVVDPSGAPSIARKAADENALGGNPLRDAVEVLRYIRVAVNEAFDVKEYSEEDLDPAYRPSEDTFPKPDHNAGVRRYDVVRPPLPRPAGLGGLQQQPPRTAHFRRMAIYVKGSRILRILEHVDVEGHKDFVEARKKGKKRLLELLKSVLAGQGPERVLPRKMSVVFSELGAKVSIRQPQDALLASLAGFFGESSGYANLFGGGGSTFAPTGGGPPGLPTGGGVTGTAEPSPAAGG